MKNSKKIIFILIFIIIAIPCFFPSRGKADETNNNIEKKIIKNIEILFKLLQLKDKTKLLQMIDKRIELKKIPRDKLLRLSDKLLNDEISITDYIILLTGNNLSYFLTNYKILSYKILSIDKESKYGGGFYYAKLKIDYYKNNKLLKNNDLEIDFLLKDNKLKLIGFII